MKKFSFKKIITVSLFPVSIIFTSGFTICFTNTISTSHFNNDITAVDLSQYDGQYLPGAENLEEKPSDKVILTRLVNAGWIEHENGIDISDIGVGGNQFKLTPRSGLNYYTGSAIVLYTLIVPTDDINSIITNPMLDATINYDLWNDSTLSKRYILFLFKQMYPVLDTNELDITADYSSDAVLKSGIGTATISVKSESLVYVSDSVNVQFHFKPRLDQVLTMGDLNINDFTTTSIYSPIWYIEGWHHNYDRLNNDCDLFKDAVNVTNSSTSSNLNLTFSLKPSNTMFYSGSQSVTLSVFDQYIDTIPEDFSYTYNADNLTASVTGFADPNLIAHMDANRLYIPNTVTNSDDGQTYTITSMSNGFSSTKVGSVYSKFAYEGTFKYLRLPNAIQEMRSNSFNMCLSFTSLLTLPTQLTSFIGSDNIQQCLFYGVYIPNCPLTLQKYSNEGAWFRTSYQGIPRKITIPALQWIEVNSENSYFMVRNQRDSDGNLIGQVLIPKTGFTTNQYLTGLTWGTLNVENIFSFDTATLPRCFAKYQLWMTNLIIPNTISSLADNSLRYCDLLNSCTFTYFDGDHGVTGWRLAYGDYNYNTTIYVPSEAISWYESQSDYEGCTILPIQ